MEFVETEPRLGCLVQEGSVEVTWRFFAFFFERESASGYKSIGGLGPGGFGRFGSTENERDCYSKGTLRITNLPSVE